jgi:hypothetical protein
MSGGERVKEGKVNGLWQHRILTIINIIINREGLG